MDALVGGEGLFFGRFRLEPNGGRLFRRGVGGEWEPVAIGSRALDILRVLIRSGDAVVSKDADFQRLSAGLGPPPKVVWLRVGNWPTRDVEALLRSRAADIRAFLADPASAVLELP